MESNYRPADSLPQPITCLRDHWLKRELNSQHPIANDKMWNKTVFTLIC